MLKKKFILPILLLPTLLFSTLPGIGMAQTDTPAKQQDSSAVKAYKTFANAFMSGKFTIALQLSTGPAKKTVQRKIDLVDKGEEQITPITEPMFMIVSEEEKESGKIVKIHGVQVVQDSSENGMFQPPDLHRQFLTMIHQDDGWLVQEFQDDKEKCCVP